MTPAQRVALITGASAGIGQACADRLAGAGWSVTGASRRGTGSDADRRAGATGRTDARGRAGAAASPWAGLVMNVDDDDSVRAGVAGVIERAGRLDALVAAAGWGIAGAAEDTSITEAKAQFETNFWGCVRLVHAVLPQLREQAHGRIVLISSLGGVIGIPFQAFYSASKFALEGYAEALSYEVAPFGVHVTLVQPGNIATSFTASRQLAGAAQGGTAYAAAMHKAITAMARDEANGAPAAQVAAVVQRVLAARRPPRRVSVGKASERVGLIARRLLPYRVFEAGAKSSLGVG